MPKKNMNKKSLPTSKRRSVQVHTYCTPQVAKKLDKYAAGQGISRSDAILEAVEKLLEPETANA